jgi:spermidine synthase
MKKYVLTAICVTGFSGIVGQMLLLREMLIVFSGNELSIGIIFANWLVLEAFGSFFVGRRAERSRNPRAAYAGMTILFSLSLPAMVYVVRVLRNLLGLSIGEGIGIAPVLCSSFLILLPVSVFHGALFTFGCRMYASLSTSDAGSVGRAYVYETLGTIAGGIAWTYFLIPHFHSFDTAFWLAAANFLVCVLLLFPHSRGAPPAAGRLAILSLLLFLSSISAILSGTSERLHRHSIRAQWAPLNPLHYQNSRYSNLCVVETEGHYTFFTDGTPHIETPVPDIAFVEEFVHIPMLAHPDPQRILVISGGAGGVISEALKHRPVKLLEYAELDPVLLELVRKFPTPLTERELNDDRVNILHVDGRLLLKTSEAGCDVLFVGLRDLSDLQTNRFFTREFFSLAQRKLNESGILVFTLPGSLTYLSDELRDLNASVFNAVKSVFPYVRGIPGDGSNLFLASSSDDIFLFDAPRFAERATERGLRTDALVPRHIENKLHPGWTGWFGDFVREGTRNINRDFRPLGVFYTVSHWNAIFTPALRAPFRWFERTPPGMLLALSLAGVACIAVFRAIRRKPGSSGIPFAVGATGFAGMMFDLALIFVFQALYGYVFAWIGLLVTSFMTGSAFGAMLATRALHRIKDDMRCFLALELAIIAFTLLLPLVFLGLQPFLENPAVFLSMRFVILFLSFVGGLLTSAQFPLANRIYLRKNGDLSRTAGLFYGSDLLGGWCGGLLVGVLFLPVLGLTGTCVATALLKVCGVLVVTARK